MDQKPWNPLTIKSLIVMLWVRGFLCELMLDLAEGLGCGHAHFGACPWTQQVPPTCPGQTLAHVRECSQQQACPKLKISSTPPTGKWMKTPWNINLQEPHLHSMDLRNNTEPKQKAAKEYTQPNTTFTTKNRPIWFKNTNKHDNPQKEQQGNGSF